MAKAASRLKKTAMKSKSSPQARAKAAPGASARQAVKKSAAKPVAKTPTAKAPAAKAPAAKPVAAKLARKAAPAKAPAAEAVKPNKWVYTFGDGKAEGKAGLKDLLGGKGANLAEMANLGLPVPPGFTIPTSVCTYFYEHDRAIRRS